MLDYEWGNPSSIVLPGDDPIQDSDPSRQILDHYAFNDALLNPHDFVNAVVPTHHHHHHHFRSSAPEPHAQFHSFYGGGGGGGVSASSYPPPPPSAPILSLDPLGSTSGPCSFMVVPKSEPVVGLDFSARIGLNLGGRTYFSSSEDDYFVDRLYLRRSRLGEPGSAMNFPRCQAEGCIADLTHAKHYHRRHKVCEFHSKAATVIAAGLTQRFCQQCSRFHLLSEFDNGKRSCRKRLADHNRRRRKSHQQSQEHLKKPKSENSVLNSSSENPTSGGRSPPDCGAQSSSSVTVAISSPKMSLDYCLQQRSHQQAAASSSTSTCSLFFPNV